MRRYVSLFAAVLFLAVLPLPAQSILPKSLAGWTDSGAPAAETFPERSQAQVLGEYGFVSFDSHSYARGADSLQAAVYKMKDPSGAYGLYSYLRTPDMSRVDLTEHSTMSNERVLALAGNLVLDVRGHDLAKSQAELKALVASIGPQAEEGLLPTLSERLPQQNMVQRSDRYILGPQTLNQVFPGNLGSSMGFATGAEAEIAHYHIGSNDVALLIADYPTPQLASQKLAELQKKFNVNDANAAGGSPVLFAKRSLTLLAIVSGAATEAEADKVLDQVHSGTELTWNEPTFQFKEPSIEAMILGTIIGAGTICMFAVIAGVSFGGLRLIVKRLWPGKVFDSTKHLEVLQLGLGSKPINSDDFYGYSAPPPITVPMDKKVPERLAMKIFR